MSSILKSKDERNRRSRNLNKDANKKLELAQSIARNSKRVENSYNSLENSMVHFFHWCSSLLDKLIFSKNFGSITALILAIVLYLAINGPSTTTNIISTSSGTKLTDVPVQVIVNSDAYEVSGIPSTVSCTVLGEASDVQLIKTQNTYKVSCDLSGLTEGSYSVPLTPVDFSSRLSVTVDPTNVVVTIKNKTTAKFKVTSQYINTNKMEGMYTLAESPSLEATEVIIKASQDTLDTIAYVKALIDVTGVTLDFDSAATVVAYNQAGQVVDVDIFPSSITAHVSVSSPSKEVPIRIVPVGTIPDDKAIESITLDHSVVTVYAPDSVLSTIDAIELEIDATKITKDSSWTYAIVMPSGVNALSVTKINIEFKIAQQYSKVIASVPVLYKNNNNGYHLEGITEEEAYLSVTVTGTKTNIDKITADSIYIYVDMSDVKVGNSVQLPVSVSGDSQLVTYTLTNGESYITADVKE